MKKEIALWLPQRPVKDKVTVLMSNHDHVNYVSYSSRVHTSGPYHSLNNINNSY